MTAKARILTALQKNRGLTLTGRDIADIASVPKGSCHAELYQLRKMGVVEMAGTAVIEAVIPERVVPERVVRCKVPVWRLSADAADTTAGDAEPEGRG